MKLINIFSAISLAAIVETRASSNSKTNPKKKKSFLKTSSVPSNAQDSMKVLSMNMKTGKKEEVSGFMVSKKEDSPNGEKSKLMFQYPSENLRNKVTGPLKLPDPPCAHCKKKAGTYFHVPISQRTNDIFFIIM